jgi:hypothetical protein
MTSITILVYLVALVFSSFEEKDKESTANAKMRVNIMETRKTVDAIIRFSSNMFYKNKSPSCKPNCINASSGQTYFKLALWSNQETSTSSITFS